MTRAFAWSLICTLFVVAAPSRAARAAELSSADVDKLAKSVTIQRDEWGVPHISGPTDASTAFGLAYAQAEDFFWQVEDTYIQALERHAEVIGAPGLSSDVLMHLFEVPSRSKSDFETLDPQLKQIAEAYVAGLNTSWKNTP